MDKTKFTSKLKKFLFSEEGYSSASLFLRVFFGIMILTHGIAKITDFLELSKTFADPIGLGSTLSVLLMIFAEVICACLIMVGLVTRLVAIPLVIGLFIATFLTAPDFVFAESESAILYLGVFMSFMIAGGGKYSVDHILKMYYQKN